MVTVSLDIPTEVDIAIVGGGLQAGLLALSLAEHAPRLRVAVFERDRELAGNHTWCFHDRDVPADAQALCDALVEHRWSGYEVIFPDRKRQLEGSYAAVTAASLVQVLRATAQAHPQLSLHTGCNVSDLRENELILNNGARVSARLVIDARGPERSAAAGRCGYQKFVGQEIIFDRPHGLTQPCLMDATLEQVQGFRFMYVLPFGEDRLLIEDTTFSRGAELDVDRCRGAINDYAQRRFGQLGQCVREEQGILPMTWARHGERPAASPVVAGYRGGWFHPATGYSFPVAVRFSQCLATSEDPCRPWPEITRLWASHRAQAGFAERLNWLLFHAFPPDAMWHVFSRFYGLPAALVHRFYSMQMSTLDRARILVGRPPKGISLTAALAAGRTP